MNHTATTPIRSARGPAACRPLALVTTLVISAASLTTWPWGATLLANPTLPAVFGDHMVLQRDQPVPVWGSAQRNEPVTVRFGDQEHRTTADASGSWRVTLDPMEASSEPRDLQVEGHSLLLLRDVLVGEVWLASGQSNMQWSVAQSADPETEIANGDHPRLRMLNVMRETAREPQDDLRGHWLVCHPETVAGFSAVGYYFARHLQGELDVPVGILHTSWGGTRVEAWTSEPTLRSTAAAAAILEAWDVRRLTWQQGGLQRRMSAIERQRGWENNSAGTLFGNIERRREGAGVQQVPGAPGAEADPSLSNHHYSNLYHQMIHPLVGYAMRGAIWYQGESNASRAVQYRELMPALIGDWRQLWAVEFPFIQVQLAGFRPQGGAQAAEQWLELQEAQLLTALNTPNTGMAVAHDIGDPADIHPGNKQEVGRRLALWALHHTYGREDVVPSGPVLSAHEVTERGMELTFDHADGLRTLADDQPVTGFELAGEDQVWHVAEAVIEDHRVIVSAEAVETPVAVRYAWDSYPERVNLVNGAGLPASSFRTDDWPRITRDRVTPD